MSNTKKTSLYRHIDYSPIRPNYMRPHQVANEKSQEALWNCDCIWIKKTVR